MLDEKMEKMVDLIEEKKALLEKIYADTDGSEKDQEAIENCLRKIVSAVLDIASRIIAVEGYRRPDSYAEYFVVLRENEVIEEELEEELQKMARFRNVVVHQYRHIDFDELKTIIEEHLEDIDHFLVSVETSSAGK